MSILVLGGAGYIGSHTVWALCERGEDVVVIDSLVTGHAEALHPAARFYRGDICDRAFLDEVLSNENIDGAIHFAAYSLVAESVANPLKYYRNNLCGTETLLEALTAHGVDRVVFSSTAAVYGEPERLPISEDSRTQPTSPYGETKLAMEKMFRWNEAAGGPKYAALRYFNACGAHPSGKIGEAHSPETHLIPLAVKTALGQRGPLELYGDDYPTPDGSCVRDYIHVLDLARAHILALRYLKDGGESGAFNLGIGEGYSNLQMIRSVERISGLSVPYEMRGRRPGDPARLIASGERAFRLLGWTPEHSGMDEIVETALRWHRAHPDGYGE